MRDYLKWQNIKSILLLLSIITTNSYFDVNGQTESKAEVVSQQTQKTQNHKVNDQLPTDCDYVRTVLDQAMYKTQNSKDSYLIIIFRLGKWDTSQAINKIRMEQIEKFIKFREATDHYILVEGSKSSGLGKAEIYVEGKIEGEIFFKPKSKVKCKETW